MTTARDIIQKALQKAGILTKNDDMSGDEASDGLFSLNALLSSWSNDDLIIYTRPLENFPLSGGVAEYTMGSGGDFDTTRPIRVVSAFVRQGSTDYPLSIITPEDYDKIVSKDTGSIPDRISTNNNFPLTTLTLYPVPTGGLSLYIRSEKALTSIATLDTTISLPDGWERALIYNLAIEISGEYGAQPDQITYQIAGDSKAAIKTAVARNRPMDSYPMVNPTYNIYTGYYT